MNRICKKIWRRISKICKTLIWRVSKRITKSSQQTAQSICRDTRYITKKIDDAIPCKEETCLDPYNPHERSSIYQYIYRNHFKTNIIRHINERLEGLDPKLPNYDKEIKNIRDVLLSLLRPETYKPLYAAYILAEYNALSDILNAPENSSINDKMFEQIRQFKASNDVQNYIRAVQDYIQKQIEWIDLAYQKASEYIADTIEEIFRKNRRIYWKDGEYII